MLMILITHKKMKAADIAEKLSVSVKSVMRYVDTMSLNGIPIVSEKGRNGGIKLGEEFTINKNYFNANELNILQTALINSANQSESTPILLKLNSLNQECQPVNESKLVHIQSHDRAAIIADKVSVITRCMQSEKSIDIRYYSRDGKYTKRKIVPLNFLIKDGEWYIYCFCLLRNEYRTFKLTRMSHIFIAEKHCLDFTNYPQQWEFNGAGEIELKLNVLPKGRFMIIDWLGVETLNSTNDADEKIIIKVQNSTDLIYKLLSFGDGIEILSPQSVVNEYNDIINKISNKYKFATIEKN